MSVVRGSTAWGAIRKEDPELDVCVPLGVENAVTGLAALKYLQDPLTVCPVCLIGSKPFVFAAGPW